MIFNIKKIFEKNKKNSRDVDFLFKLLVDKANKFTKEEIKESIIKEGYNKKVANKVVNKIYKNKTKFKIEDKNKTTSKKELEKQKLLKELSSTISEGRRLKLVNSENQDKVTIKKNIPKPNALRKENLKTSNKVADHKEKLNNKKQINVTNKINTKLNENEEYSNIFKRIYFFFENIYYSIIDGISKVVPIYKLTDKIDNVFPSFILFLFIIIILVYLIFFSGLSLVGSKTWNINVTVTDNTDSSLKNAQVMLIVNDNNFVQETDVWGETVFENVKGKGLATLKVSKKDFNSETIKFELNKENLYHKIKLFIDTTANLEGNDNIERYRLINFVNNNNLIVGETLAVNFYCTSSNKHPTPTSKNITNGEVQVIQPAGCGKLRVSVQSNLYNKITNQVVPENNKVELTKKNTNTGNLLVKVRDIRSNPISDAYIKVYSIDDPTTDIDESQGYLKTGTTDMYGSYTFSLVPGSYLISVDKEGYISAPKSNKYSVIINNTTNVEELLLTPEDLQNIDCSVPEYSMFCLSGKLDCDNPILQPYITMISENDCVVGNMGYLDITLKDLNTNQLVKANISLYKKNKDTNNYSNIATREDTNHTVFNVLDSYKYQVRVSGTENTGYLIPEPLDVNTLDINKIIYLENLPGGTIGVNVKDNGWNVSNASVYLYYGSGDYEGELVIPEPNHTNSEGDCNFVNLRPNKKYYAYAIKDNSQGISDISDRLDSNEFLELNTYLESMTSRLNLKVNVLDYNITFYNLSHEEITEYVIEDIEGTDQNKEYIFNNGETGVYAVISKDGYKVYQTSEITLIVGQESFKEVTLELSSNCPSVNLQFLGLYDSTGSLPIENIDFVDNTLDKEYKLKYKFSTCSGDKELTYAEIRAGNQILISDDYIYLTDLYLFDEDAVIDYGYSFNGESEEFDFNHFNNYYNFDHQYDWNGDGEKWVNIDFTNSTPETIEFSINFKFKNGISPSDNYVINYRALTKENSFSFDPSFSNSEDWYPQPESYFYAKTNKYNIPFSTQDYVLSSPILIDTNSGEQLEENGDSYILYLDNNYLYSLNFIYLKETPRLGNYVSSSEYTENNLIYKEYNFIDKLNNIYYSEPNDIEYTIQDINASRGYYFDVNSLITPIDFFNTSPSIDPSINTSILNFNPELKVPVKAYVGNNDYILKIITDNQENDVYVGDNNVSFEAYSNTGNPLSDIDVFYDEGVGQPQELGVLANGILVPTELISIPLDKINSNVKFIFRFDSSYGFQNNEVAIYKQVKSGYKLYDLQNLEITLETPLISNPLVLDLGDGVKESTLINQKYYIKKLTNNVPLLKDISFSVLNGINNINIEDTNSNIISQNNYPISLYDENKLIKLPIRLNLENIIEPTNSKIEFSNKLRIGEYNQEPIISLLDLNSILNIDYISINKQITGPENGFYKTTDGNINIELINNISDQISINYNLINISDRTLTLNNITVANGVQGVNIDNLNDSLSQYNNSDITAEGLTINIPISLEQDAQENVDNLILDFNLSVGRETSVVYSEKINVKIYDSDDIYKINYPLGMNKTIVCTSDIDCNTSIPVEIKNNTKSYDLNLSQIVDTNYSDVPLSIDNIDLPKYINRNSNITIPLVVESNYSLLGNNYYGTDKLLGINFKFGLMGNELQKDTNLTFTVICTEDVQDTLSNNGLTGKFCLGVGGEISDDGIFILGNCNQESTDECKTGEDALPKVIYYWGASNSDVDWKNACVSDSSNLISNKYYCDSIQMLMSTFLRLEDSNKDEFYINLVSDGVSKDLLHDFIAYTNDYTGMQVNLIENNIFTDENVDNGKFTISKNSNKPGTYKVTINDNFTTSCPSELHIDLTLVSELPYNKRNIFYYLPIDGLAGYTENADQNRDGYGAQVNYIDTDPEHIININDSVDLNTTNNLQNSPVVINAHTYNKIINPIDLKNVLRSEGKLFNLNLDSQQNNQFILTLDYSPSYPVPIYARATCIQNKNLNYALNIVDNDNTLEIPFSPFLVWKDYNSSNPNEIEDRAMNYGGVYNSHSVKLNDFYTSDYALITTMLYVPAYNINLNNYKLSLEKYDNDINSFLYGIGNLNSTKELTLNSKVELDNVNSIKSLFNLVKQNKACIYSGIATTYIKWLDDYVNLSDQNINTIIENSKIESDNPGFNCNYYNQ